MRNWKLKITEGIGIAKGLSFYRIKNLITHAVFHLFRLTPRVPLYFSFEPTTACNLSCPECPSGLGQFTRPEGNSSSNTFNQLIAEWGKKASICTFYFQGEPFIHPQIYDYIKTAHTAGLYTISSSNGHFFNAQGVERLAKSGLSKLIISVDGITEESYLKYRVGGDFGKVLNGLWNLSEARLNGRLKTTIVLQFIVFSHNEHELEEIPTFLEGFPGVDFFVTKTAQVYGADVESYSRLPRNQKYNRYMRPAPAKGCSRMERGAVVTWDGKVLPCCFDKDGDNAFGNGIEHGFSTIWSNKRSKVFRRSVRRSRINRAICSNCSEGRKVFV